MRLLVEVTWEANEEDDEGEVVYNKGKFWLHHWGLRMDIIETGNGGFAVGNWTVAICEDYNTGAIRCFFPDQLKVIGTNINQKP